MIFNINTTREITYNDFEISLVVFTPNIITNHAITYTNENNIIMKYKTTMTTTTITTTTNILYNSHLFLSYSQTNQADTLDGFSP